MVLNLNTSEKGAWQFLMVKLRPFSCNQIALDALSSALETFCDHSLEAETM